MICKNMHHHWTLILRQQQDNGGGSEFSYTNILHQFDKYRCLIGQIHQRLCKQVSIESVQLENCGSADRCEQIHFTGGSIQILDNKAYL